ncbi:hypothetical protein XSR1_340045 [Xenorhabdus szentirmaii DSM 16338]|uniref:Uncharacterized protein n=1 Tax=Xenorhabdus szentirmaii DSM 16338 TaxID=1427518 RepID=W1J2F9_9GAMM|nr:hypothetical protein XSR1_340045 [Xenorhabdus szentirmaii DSM 16338]
MYSDETMVKNYILTLSFLNLVYFCKLIFELPASEFFSLSHPTEICCVS